MMNSTSHLLTKPRQRHPLFNHRRSSFFGRCFPIVNTAAERHVGIVNICFQETFEDPSLQSFFARISCSACAVTVISDTIIDLFTLPAYRPRL